MKLFFYTLILLLFASWIAFSSIVIFFNLIEVESITELIVYFAGGPITGIAGYVGTIDVFKKFTK